MISMPVRGTWAKHDTGGTMEKKQRIGILAENVDPGRRLVGFTGKDESGLESTESFSNRLTMVV
jgi:hypothetical protein